jgi:DNA-directed RNA polymerase subunit F
MGKLEILKEEPITMAAMKAELENIKKRDEELNFRANKTEEYLAQFDLPNDKKVEEIIKKIEGLKIPRLKDFHIVKIIDLMPKTVEEMKGILQGYTITVTQDNMKKILAKINE